MLFAVPQTFKQFGVISTPKAKRHGTRHLFIHHSINLLHAFKVQIMKMSTMSLFNAQLMGADKSSTCVRPSIFKIHLTNYE